MLAPTGRRFAFRPDTCDIAAKLRPRRDPHSLRCPAPAPPRSIMRYSLRILLALCLAGLQLIAVLVVVFSSSCTSERALIAHRRDLLRDGGTTANYLSQGFLSRAQC